LCIMFMTLQSRTHKLNQLNVAEPLLETLRTLKKFCLFYSNPSTRHFTISCAKLIPHFIFVTFILIISCQLPGLPFELYHILRPKIFFFSLFLCVLHAHFILLDLLITFSGLNSIF